MSMTGMWSPASANTSSRLPTAATIPSLTRMASVTGGSSIVRIRPTMTRDQDADEGALAAALRAGEILAVGDDDAELVPLGEQPPTRVSTTSKARSAAGTRTRGTTR